MSIVKKMTEEIAGYFQQKGIIESGQEEIYSYGLQEMFVDMLNIISIFLISLFFGQLLEAVVFIIAFRLLRSYAGGYHAKTQWHCYFLTMFTIVTALSIIKYINVSMIVSIALWILSGVIIFLWSPVEAENKPLDEIEIRIYGKKAKLIFLMETICFLVSLACNWISMYESILLAVICTSMSLVAVNVKKFKVQI